MLPQPGWRTVLHVKEFSVWSGKIVNEWAYSFQANLMCVNVSWELQGWWLKRAGLDNEQYV